MSATRKFNTRNMYTIVGLGNPGQEYENTRHNAGRIVLEAVRKAHDFSDWKVDSKKKAQISTGLIKKIKTTLVMPETFMNKSGQSVAQFVKSAKQAGKLVVVYDDLDLPIGRMKISFNRSSGGHKGVESIIRAVKTEAFVRIRVGISPTTASGKLKKPHGDAVVGDFILHSFKPAELAELKKVSKRATQAIEMVVIEGHERAMGEFNAA